MAKLRAVCERYLDNWAILVFFQGKRHGGGNEKAACTLRFPSAGCFFLFLTLPFPPFRLNYTQGRRQHRQQDIGRADHIFHLVRRLDLS